jgi:di- and tripeptidase
VTPRPPGSFLSTNSDGRLLTFKRTHYRAYAHSSYVYCMLLVPALRQRLESREVLVTGGGDGTIKLWSLDRLETAGLTEIQKFKNCSTSVLSLADNGIFLYAGLGNGRVHVYNLESRQLVQKINVGSGDVTTIQVVHGVAFCGTSSGHLKVSAFS